jgi:hypothetical protein
MVRHGITSSWGLVASGDGPGSFGPVRFVFFFRHMTASPSRPPGATDPDMSRVARAVGDRSGRTIPCPAVYRLGASKGCQLRGPVRIECFC